jgi:hypothetical protein
MKRFLLFLSLLVSCLTWRVSAATVGDTYKLVTSIDDIELGAEYILTYDTNAMGDISGTNKYFSNVSTGVTLSTDKTEATIKSTDVLSFKIVKGTTNYALSYETSSGTVYAQCTSTSNGNVTTSSTLVEESDFTIAINSKTYAATITFTKNSNSNSNKFQYNTSSPRYTNYKTGTQKDCTIYKKVVDEGGETLEANGLEWSAESVIATGEYTLPTLKNPNNLSVTYSSSNTAAATIDATTGAVTIPEGAYGTTTITATFAGNDTYKAGSVSYTLSVPATATSIADFIAKGKTDSSLQIYVNFPLTVGATNKGGTQAYVTDGTQWIQIYESGKSLTKFSEGSVIPAGWTATYTLYATYTSEMIPVGTVPDATSTATLTIPTVEYSALTTADANRVIVAPKVTFSEATPSGSGTFTGTDAEGKTVSLSNVFQVESVAAGTYNVKAVVYVTTKGAFTLDPLSYTDTDAKLAWSAESVTTDWADRENCTLPTLTNPNNVDVTYTSTNADVATVTDGAITLGTAAGTTTITATPTDAASWTGSASVTITVNAKPEVAAPTFNIEINDDEAVANIGDKLTVSCATEGATIEWTIDDTAIEGTEYEIPESMAGNEYPVSAKAYVTSALGNKTYSEETDFLLKVNEKGVITVSAPKFAINGEDVDDEDDVTAYPGDVIAVSCATAGATLAWTYEFDDDDDVAIEGDSFTIPAAAEGSAYIFTATAAVGETKSDDAMIMVEVAQLPAPTITVPASPKAGDVITVAAPEGFDNVYVSLTVDGVAVEGNSFTIPTTAEAGETFAIEAATCRDFGGATYTGATATATVTLPTETLTYSWTVASETPNETEMTLGDVTWGVSYVGTPWKADKNGGTNPYLYFGAGSTTMTELTLTTKAFDGCTISKVIVTSFLSGTSQPINVYVGGEKFGETATNTTTKTEYTFTGSASAGELKLVFGIQSGKQLKLYSIQVEYTKTPAARDIKSVIDNDNKTITITGLTSKKDVLKYKLQTSASAAPMRRVEGADDGYATAVDGQDNWTANADLSWTYDATNLGDDVLLVKVIGANGSESAVLDFETNDGQVVTAITEVNAASDSDAAVEYFNLNGMRTRATTPGLYIRRVGTRAELQLKIEN